MEFVRSTIFVICEYNPFHSGHEYQIKEFKKTFKTVICIMSGSVVQRGECAVADKYTRAKAAVLCGADLVLELPFPHSVAAARDFASAGIYIANALGGSFLGFGLEDDLELIKNVSAVLEDSTGVKEIIRTRKNISYPCACQEHIREKLGDKAAQAAGKPNNILGIEYIKNCKLYGIEPFAVTRSSQFASSTEIRNLFSKDKQAAFMLMPRKSAEVYTELNEFKRIEKLEAALIAALRMRENGEVYGFTASDMNLVEKIAQETDNYNKLLELCSTKTLTKAAVRRGILANFFGITKNEIHKKPLFTTVLAANKKGCSYLHDNAKIFKIPVITRPAHIKKQKQKVVDAFMRNVKVENVLSLCGGNSRNPMKMSPYIEGEL